jgi:hypothetical protein
MPITNNQKKAVEPPATITAPPVTANALPSSIPRIIVICGSIAMLVGVFLPWVKLLSVFGDRSFIGVETVEGIVLSVIGALLLIGALSKKGVKGEIYSWPIGVFGLIALVIVLLKGWSISGALLSGDLFTMSIGAGVYLTGLGAFLVIIGGFLHS